MKGVGVIMASFFDQDPLAAENQWVPCIIVNVYLLDKTNKIVKKQHVYKPQVDGVVEQLSSGFVQAVKSMGRANEIDVRVLPQNDRVTNFSVNGLYTVQISIQDAILVKHVYDKEIQSSISVSELLPMLSAGK
jgi:S-adenosylhomocysteine hydrolase